MQQWLLIIDVNLIYINYVDNLLNIIGDNDLSIYNEYDERLKLSIILYRVSKINPVTLSFQLKQ